MTPRQAAKNERLILSTLGRLAVCLAALLQFVRPPSARATDEVTVLPSNVGSLGNVVIDSQINTFKSSLTLVNVHYRCFGTNLRSVSNPLSPTSTITMKLTFSGSDGSDKDVVVDFPAKWVQPYYAGIDTGSTDLVTAPPGTRARGMAGILKLEIESLARVPLNASGDFDIKEKNQILKSARFFQTMAPGASTGRYLGADGPLSGTVRWQTSPSNGQIDISVAFPGQAGFCGGYFSPLMLFFDHRRPQFTGQSRFALTSAHATYHWPEANAPGAFLAADHNQDGLINDGNELFGDNERFENGFLRLAEFDANKDGQIDARDPIFSKLLLWSDRNGNGVSEPEELSPLSKRNVISIPLKFETVRESFGDRAEYRQRAKFTFTDAQGSTKTGDVLDVYFKGIQIPPAPATPPNSSGQTKAQSMAK